MLNKISIKLIIKFIQWELRRNKLNNIELVIRDDGYTYYKRNKKREESVKETLKLIK